jgi:hypothetical protein
MISDEFIFLCDEFALSKLAKYKNVSPNHIEHTSTHDPFSFYDLRHQNTRYQVKIANPITLSKKSDNLVWEFEMRVAINGKKKTPDACFCEYYLLVGVVDGIPKKCFMLPFYGGPKNHVRISINGKSKYLKYEI